MRELISIFKLIQNKTRDKNGIKTKDSVLNQDHKMHFKNFCFHFCDYIALVRMNLKEQSFK